ncbi:hypothetical protein I6E74_03240 [Salinibacterium sp. SWN139]|uniref:hypothetical protein n=1 Tax=Salinibacterium sp. SWN139 TaxID=2792055 RepID=UPI0018CD34AB|nr:hypothetical protein [Salinibacterium sp. SWN139]MBH0053181.1 hypothetical protein [Salinibacterium sp. SWN139]
MQYHTHPDSGKVMLTQPQLERLREALATEDILESWADIWHGADTFSESEASAQQEQGRPVQAGDVKPLHNHAAVKLKPGREKSIRYISELASIPSARIATPKESPLQSGMGPSIGPLAAKQAFFDFCQYLVHGGRSQRNKFQYAHSEVHADFDFSALLAAGRPGRKKGSSATSSMTSRKQALRRAVGHDGVKLTRAREMDYDAYAEDLPRLRALAKDFLDLPENQPNVGEGGVYRKSSVLIGGASRQGKDVLAQSITAFLIAFARDAGQQWEAVKPSGEHSAEDVGQAQIAHHEDVRFRVTRSYDDALRYLDPNQAPRQAARNSNLTAVAPRAILMTSSETLGSLALSLKARKDSVDLVNSRDDYAAVNVDEFLFRLGWHVEVSKPSWVGLRDLANTKTEMTASIFRIEEGPEYRKEKVEDRDGVALGVIRTKHWLNPVAIIKGVENAARFLAISIIEEYSPDIAASIPDTIEAFIPVRSAAAEHAARAHEERMTLIAVKKLGKRSADHFREAHLAGVQTSDPSASIFEQTDGVVNCGLCALAA